MATLKSWVVALFGVDWTTSSNVGGGFSSASSYMNIMGGITIVMIAFVGALLIHLISSIFGR